MPGVIMPQQQQSSMAQILPIGGAVVGGIFGGPAGAAAGASLGGMAGNTLASNGPPPTPVQSGMSGAMDRRAQSLQDNPSNQLAQADAALAQMPPEYQAQFGPTIKQARYLDQNGGVA